MDARELPAAHGIKPISGGNRHCVDITDTIDALMAFDRGATDSGINDDSMKCEVIEHINGLDDLKFRQLCAKVCRKFLTDEAILQGYGIPNIIAFGEWLGDNGIDLH